MTENEWQSSNDAQEMLVWLWRHRRPRPSERKLRLIACACNRRIWDLIADERSQAAVHIGELFADGNATDDERRQACEAATNYFDARNLGASAAVCCAHVDAIKATGGAIVTTRIAAENKNYGRLDTYSRRLGASLLATEKREQANLVREIFGNPFALCPFAPEWRTWRDSSVAKLAEVAYQERDLPTGHFRAEKLMVLADCLEEAGCSEATILGHLRQPGAAHVRGCWVVDLCLRRS